MSEIPSAPEFLGVETERVDVHAPVASTRTSADPARRRLLHLEKYLWFRPYVPSIGWIGIWVLFQRGLNPAVCAVMFLVCFQFLIARLCMTATYFVVRSKLRAVSSVLDQDTSEARRQRYITTVLFYQNFFNMIFTPLAFCIPTLLLFLLPISTPEKTYMLLTGIWYLLISSCMCILKSAPSMTFYAGSIGRKRLLLLAIILHSFLAGVLVSLIETTRGNATIKILLLLTALSIANLLLLRGGKNFQVPVIISAFPAYAMLVFNFLLVCVLMFILGSSAYRPHITSESMRPGFMKTTPTFPRLGVQEYPTGPQAGETYHNPPPPIYQPKDFQ